MTKTKRPKWARQLTRSEWQHLQDAQARKTPTLRDLRADVELGPCRECRLILEKVKA